MKYLVQLSIFLLICSVGEILSNITNNFISGNLFGMLILLILLIAGTIKIENVQGTGNFFLENMALFYLPGCVSILNVYNDMKNLFLPIIVICIVTTVITALITGYSVSLVLKIQNRRLSKGKG